MEELREKMTVTARYTLSIPELYPVVGFRKDQANFPLSSREDQWDQGCIVKLREVKSTTVRTGNLHCICMHVDSAYSYI